MFAFDYLHFVNCESGPASSRSVEQGCLGLHTGNQAVWSNEHPGSNGESSVGFRAQPPP